MEIPPVMPPIMSDASHLSGLPNVEEPMKYQALRPQFFSVGRWGVVEWVVVVVEWGVGRGGVVGWVMVGVGVGRGVCGRVGGGRVGMGGVVGWVVVGWW